MGRRPLIERCLGVASYLTRRWLDAEVFLERLRIDPRAARRTWPGAGAKIAIVFPNGNTGP